MNNKFICYGLLWNKDFSFASEFLETINKKFSINSIINLNVQDELYAFVKDIYPPLLPDEYAKFKSIMLRAHKMGDILIYNFTVENPIWKYSEEEEHYYCAQVKDLKNKLRETYVPRVKDYVHDILAHFADDDYESGLIINAMEKRKDKIVEVSYEEIQEQRE